MFCVAAAELFVKLFFFTTYSYSKKVKDLKCQLSVNFPPPYQTLLCRFEGLGREAVQAEQPGFVIGGTGTETIYQQTKWRTWLFSIWLSFDIVRFA